MDASRNLKLKTQDGVTATIPLKNSSKPQTSANKILSYHPEYAYIHRSGLAGKSVNIRYFHAVLQALSMCQFAVSSRAKKMDLGRKSSILSLVTRETM